MVWQGVVAVEHFAERQHGEVEYFDETQPPIFITFRRAWHTPTTISTQVREDVILLK